MTKGGSQLTWEGGRAGINKNVSNAGSQLTFTLDVTHAGSQITWEGGRAGISKNVTDTKRDRRGVTTDLLDV